MRFRRADAVVRGRKVEDLTLHERAQLRMLAYNRITVVKLDRFNGWAPWIARWRVIWFERSSDNHLPPFQLQFDTYSHEFAIHKAQQIAQSNKWIPRTSDGRA